MIIKVKSQGQGESNSFSDLEAKKIERNTIKWGPLMNKQRNNKLKMKTEAHSRINRERVKLPKYLNLKYI